MKHKLQAIEDMFYADIPKLATALEMPAVIPDRSIVNMLCQAAILHRHTPEDNPVWVKQKRHLEYSPGYYSEIIDSEATQADVQQLVAVLQARWENEVKAGRIAKVTLAKAALPPIKLAEHLPLVLADVQVLIAERRLDKAPGVGIVGSLIALAVMHRTASENAFGGSRGERSLPYEPDAYSWAGCASQEDVAGLIEAVAMELYFKAVQ